MRIKSVAMTIAGSDPTGGAGIQADMRTFETMGVKGVSVISALTAQNENKVAGIKAVDADFVALQIETVLEVDRVDSVKTGMLFSNDIIKVVADLLTKHKVKNLVVDPVMEASAGGTLMEPSAVKTLTDKLFPLAHLITPNIPEAEAITGLKVTDINSMKEAAIKLGDLGSKNVVITGGHMENARPVDLLLTDGEFFEFSHERVNAKDTHGTGCVFSSAIAALLAKGEPIMESVSQAGKFVAARLKQNF